MGRNFTEALGKAMRSMETKVGRLLDRPPRTTRSAEELLDALRVPARRPALHRRAGAAPPARRVEQVAEASGFDPWFVDQIALVREVGDEPSATRRP